MTVPFENQGSEELLLSDQTSQWRLAILIEQMQKGTPRTYPFAVDDHCLFFVDFVTRCT